MLGLGWLRLGLNWLRLGLGSWVRLVRFEYFQFANYFLNSNQANQPLWNSERYGSNVGQVTSHICFASADNFLIQTSVRWCSFKKWAFGFSGNSLNVINFLMESLNPNLYLIFHGILNQKENKKACTLCFWVSKWKWW